MAKATIDVTVRVEPLTAMDGRGKELCDLLRNELHVPAGVTRFSVTFDMHDVIRVNCDYAPMIVSEDGKPAGKPTE